MPVSHENAGIRDRHWCKLDSSKCMETIRSAISCHVSSMSTWRCQTYQEANKHVHIHNIFQLPAAALFTLCLSNDSSDASKCPSAHCKDELPPLPVTLPVKGSEIKLLNSNIALLRSWEKSNLYNYHLQRVVQHSCSHDSSRQLWLYACVPTIAVKVSNCNCNKYQTTLIFHL